jgi:hypothetical protein
VVVVTKMGMSDGTARGDGGAWERGREREERGEKRRKEGREE